MKDEPDIVKQLRKEDKYDHKIKIMVVDDKPGVRFTIKAGLEEIGSNFEFIDAKDGMECLDILKNNIKPDIILLDIMMPKMDGWDVASEIKKNPNWDKIPIIFLTAVTDTSSKTFGGIVSDDYITKPFEIDDLKRRIDKALREKNE